MVRTFDKAKLVVVIKYSNEKSGELWRNALFEIEAEKIKVTTAVLHL